jgi:prephenate dehydrogenase
MDMGSTKGEICAALDALPPHVQPIGGHPMTGKETAGFEAAEANLYRNATWVLTPLPRTTAETVALSTELVEAVGAHPVILPAERHDQLVATISHLPFLAASALVHTAKEMGKQDPTVWELAAGGYRDTSRVAASDTRMFVDILMTNQPAVLAQLDHYIGQLTELRALVNDEDEAALASKLAISQAARAHWKPKR